MILTVTDLSVARGGLVLLDGVNLTLDAGQALMLRGPNGVGKTSLLRTVAGLQPPEGGQLSVTGGLSYAAHADGIKTALSVDENLFFWTGIYGSALIFNAKSAMGLETLGDRPARELSAGQRRRVGLARLLVAERALWLLDEPTVSLDAASVLLLAAAVRAHLAGGGAALIATHVDLGLPEAADLDLTRYRARVSRGDFDGIWGAA